jgi:negative regulator of flagellin synthesis FlgM
MRIENILRILVNEIEETKKEKIEKTGKTTDKIEISKESEMLNKIKEILNEEEKIDEEKINRIKEEIESGKYNIDTKTIVQKLIEDIF